MTATKTKRDIVAVLREGAQLDAATYYAFDGVYRKTELEAADEIERLRSLLKWCRVRLKTEGYQQRLDEYLAGPVKADHTPLTQTRHPFPNT